MDLPIEALHLDRHAGLQQRTSKFLALVAQRIHGRRDDECRRQTCEALGVQRRGAPVLRVLGAIPEIKIDEPVHGRARQRELLGDQGPDVDLPYLLRPDVTTTLRGITIRTNRLGLREAEIMPLPPAGTRRVLLLGDSVVFGQELPDEQILGTEVEMTIVAGKVAYRRAG